jgi:hypothetical protein
MKKTTKRKQHYVPRFYLKLFSDSTSKGLIRLWNLRRQLYVKAAAISDQAYEDFFYGVDGVLEEKLADVETQVSELINKIVTDRRLPSSPSEGMRLLFMFVMYQADRTKATATDVEATLNRLATATFQDDAQRKEVIENAPWTLSGPAAFALETLTPSLPLILDLRAKLILNTTEHEFMTSDNPVIRYNQFYEYRRRPGSGAGWSLPGLQIFLPLSPKILLMLFDSDVYNVGRDNEETVLVDRTGDVNWLNGLQFLRADENIYIPSNVTEEHIARMHKRWAKYRRPRVHTQEYSGVPSPSGGPTKGKLIVTEFNDLKIDLQLSFISYRIDPGARQLSPTLWNPRNEQVAKVLESIYGRPPRDPR